MLFVISSHDMADGDFKNLTRRTASDKLLRDRLFDMLKIQTKMDINEYLFHWFIIFFCKTSSDGADKSKILEKQRLSDLARRSLAEESHKPIIRKFEKQKVYSSLKGNIWSDALEDMQLIINFNEGICFLLCVIGCSFRRQKRHYNYQSFSKFFG